MRRGTTPINTFITDLDLSETTVFISYEQGGRKVLEKTGDDLSFSPGTETGTYKIETTLTQEDTLKFKSEAVYIQIRAVYADGSAVASNIIHTSVERIIKDGVIVYV